MSLKRSLGQHILHDPEVIRRIVEHIPPNPQRIVEIGPGSGAITFPLIARQREILAIEKDRGFARRLSRMGVAVLEADATSPSWVGAIPPGEWGVAGNLPYNASTAILRNLLFHYTRFPWFVLMFQKEVGERLVAKKMREAGPLTILVQTLYTGKILFFVPPSAFRPPPKVESALLLFERRSEPPCKEEELPGYWGFLSSAFTRRRGLLLHALTRYHPLPRVRWLELFKELGLSPRIRCEELDLPLFFELWRRSSSR